MFENTSGFSPCAKTRFQKFSLPRIRVPHTPGFPAKGRWGDSLHAAFLNESRTRDTGWHCVQEIRVSRSFFARCGFREPLLWTLSVQSRLNRSNHPQICHPDRSAAKWSDLRCAFPPNNSWVAHISLVFREMWDSANPSSGLFLSNPTSTEATTLRFVIPTEAQRSGGTCGAPFPPTTPTRVRGRGNFWNLVLAHTV
jgi:hypothetical protein